MARACFCPVARIGSEVWSMCAARLQRPPTHLGQQLGEWEGSLHAQPGAGNRGPGPRFLLSRVFCSPSDPSTRSWPLGGRVEGGEDEEEEESFLQPVDDYFVAPPRAEEEEEEEKVPPASSHTPAGVSKGEAASEPPVPSTLEGG